MVAAHHHHAGVPETSAFEDRKVRRTATNIDQRNAEVLFVLGQHGLGRRELFDHRVNDVHTGLVDAGNDVLRRGGGARDHMHVDLEPGPCHAERGADAILLINDEILRKDMEDLPAGGQGHRFRRLDRPSDVVAGNLTILAGNRNHTAAIEPLHVGTGKREVHRVDLNSGHQLRLLDGVLDRLDGRFQIDDNAAFDSS